MTSNTYLSRQSKETWKYAFIGGIISIPFTFGLYWWSGMGNYLSMNMILLGGVLAGFLAKNSSLSARSAGISSGVIGGLPVVVWGLSTLIGIPDGSLTVWSSPVLEAAFLIFIGFVLLGMAALAGLIGGMIGGWLSKKFGTQRTPSVSS